MLNVIKYFVAGFLIAFFFDSVSTILSYIVEWIKMSISVRIAKKQVEIAKMQNEPEELVQTRAIGFAIPNDDWGDLDEE